MVLGIPVMTNLIHLLVTPEEGSVTPSAVRIAAPVKAIALSAFEVFDILLRLRKIVIDY